MALFDITSSYNNIIITDEDGIVNNIIEKNIINVSVDGVNVVIRFANLSFIQPYTNITVASAVPSSASDAKTLIDALIVYPWSKVSKRLVMSIAQSGTDAPTMTILLNELSGTFTFSYLAAGTYILTSGDSSFTLARTKVHGVVILVEDMDASNYAALLLNGYADSLILKSWVQSDVGVVSLSNDIITGQIFEIEVYPV